MDSVAQSARGVRVVRNTRAWIDRDSCGQAAIATVLACHRAGPLAAHESLDDAAAIDLVRASAPPDLPFGLGTSPWRIAAALRAAGVDARVAHGGPFGLGAGRVWRAVRAAIAGGVPVPVCLDDGRIGGAAWGAHWAVVTAVDGPEVTLGNAPPLVTVPLARFLAAWRCRHLPWPFGHCAVIPAPPRAP